MLLIKLLLLKYIIWLLIITYKNMVDKHIYQYLPKSAYALAKRKGKNNVD